MRKMKWINYKPLNRNLMIFTLIVGGIRLKLFMDILFFIVIAYLGYKFIQVLIKMKQKVILPTTNEECAAIRKIPGKAVDLPTYSKQKIGIIIYSFMLLFVIAVFLFEILTHNFGWSFYLLFFLPLSYSYNLLNLFAIVEGGLLSGSRFIAWDKIKSFHFIPIDINHKYYGYSKEVNGGYELKVKAKLSSTSCIVTSDEMKERLSNVLSEYVKVNEEESAVQEPR